MLIILMEMMIILIWGTILPYLILSIVFTIIYLIVPNTKVNLRPALIGGITAGIFWQVSSILFAKGVASSTKYFAIYSSLAILILFMIWQYISWLIVLIGAQISYCAQKLDYSGRKFLFYSYKSPFCSELSCLSAISPFQVT